MRYRVLFATALLFVPAAASDSFGQARQRARDCVVAGALSPFGFDSSGVINVAAGQSCNLSLSTSGTIEAAQIAERPQNGQLRMRGLSSAVYTPKAGFRGTDEFAFTITGRNQNVSGTSTVRITANVN